MLACIGVPKRLRREATELSVDDLPRRERVASVDLPHGAREGMFELWREDAEPDGGDGPGADDKAAVAEGPLADAGKRWVSQRA